MEAISYFHIIITMFPYCPVLLHIKTNDSDSSVLNNKQHRDAMFLQCIFRNFGYKNSTKLTKLSYYIIIKTN